LAIATLAAVALLRTVTAITPTVGAVTAAGVAPTVSKPTVTAMVPTVGAIAVAGVASTVAQSIGPVVSVGVPFESATITWPSMPNGLAGSIHPPMRYRTASFQVFGVFGAGGSIKLQGSNDGANWADLTPTALTGAGWFAALGASERPKYIRPNCTAGDATTALTVVGWFS